MFGVLNSHVSLFLFLFLYLCLEKFKYGHSVLCNSQWVRVGKFACGFDPQKSVLLWIKIAQCILSEDEKLIYLSFVCKTWLCKNVEGKQHFCFPRPCFARVFSSLSKLALCSSTGILYLFYIHSLRHINWIGVLINLFNCVCSEAIVIRIQAW